MPQLIVLRINVLIVDKFGYVISIRSLIGVNLEVYLRASDVIWISPPFFANASPPKLSQDPKFLWQMASMSCRPLFFI
jgi:hypothetical protein